MPFVGYGWNGFGQVIGVTSPVLKAEVHGAYWAQYPSNWTSGLAQQIRPSTRMGGSPEGWNLIPVNLAKMLKRMESISHPLLSRDEAALLGRSA